MTEGQYINQFLSHFSWELGRRGISARVATNLLQAPGKLDPALGDAQIGVNNCVVLIEFKSGDTTASPFSKELSKDTKGSGIRKHMRNRMRLMNQKAIANNEECKTLRDIARRAWWFAIGNEKNAVPDVVFWSYEKTLYQFNQLNPAGNVNYWGSLESFVENFLLHLRGVDSGIGVSQEELKSLLEYLFANTPEAAINGSASSDRLLVIELPGKSIGLGGKMNAARWATQTVKSYFKTDVIPKGK